MIKEYTSKEEIDKFDKPLPIEDGWLVSHMGSCTGKLYDNICFGNWKTGGAISYFYHPKTKEILKVRYKK